MQTAQNTIGQQGGPQDPGMGGYQDPNQPGYQDPTQGGGSQGQNQGYQDPNQPSYQDPTQTGYQDQNQNQGDQSGYEPQPRSVRGPEPGPVGQPVPRDEAARRTPAGQQNRAALLSPRADGH